MPLDMAGTLTPGDSTDSISLASPSPSDSAPSRVRLNIDGHGIVDVDSSFLKLSPEQQQATVEEIAQSFRRSDGPPKAPPDTSFRSALAHGAADVLAPVAQTLGTPGSPVYAPGIAKTLHDTASAIAPSNYQPADPTGAFKRGDYLDALSRVPRALTEQAGNVGAYMGLDAAVGGAVGAASGPAGAITGPASGIAAQFGLGALQTLGPIAVQRARNQGRDAPNDDDWAYAKAAAGAQGIVMATVGRLAKGLGAEPAETLLQGAGRTAAAAGLNTGAMTTGNLIGQAAATAGTPGGIRLDPTQALGDALVGAAAFSAPHALGSAARSATGAAVDAVQGLTAPGKSGENVRAYAAEVKPWTDAVQAQAAAISRAQPDLPPDRVQELAQQEAQKAGASPPSYETLSPKAQNGLAEMSAISLYQARRQAETDGMGRDDADMTPGRTFKGVMDDLSRNLNATADGLVRAGLLTRDQAGPLYDAVSEARRHNRQAAEGGDQFGYFDTFRDKVADLPIDPAYRNQILLMLRTLDVASANSLEYRSKGPFELATKVLPWAGAGAEMAGVLTGGIPGLGGVTGFLAGKGAQYGALTAARALDQAMGTSLPPVLRRADAVQRFARDNSLPPVADPLALQEMQAELATLRQPAGTPAAPTPVPQGAQPLSAAPLQPAAPKTPGAPTASPQSSGTVDPSAAFQTLQQVLQARAGHLSAMAQEALPSDRRGWSAAMANTLGVAHGPMMSRLQQELAGSPELASLLSQHALPPDVLRAFTNRMADLRDSGEIPWANDFARQWAAAGGPVRNPLSYGANLAQEADTAAAIMRARPDLSGVVNTMRDPTVNGKTKEGRRAALETYLGTVKDPAERARQEAILAPLAGFGR